MDTVVLSSAVARAAGALSGPISAAALVGWLTVDEQGYWYTFTSLLAIAGSAELGAGQVVMQLTAHEWAAKHSSDPNVSRSAEKRLSAILRLCAIWAGLLVVAIWMIALGVGFAWLNSNPSGGKVAWRSPWLAAASIAPGALALALLNSFLEGCQDIVGANMRRAAQAFVQMIGVVGGLALGGKLWAYAGGQALVLVVGVSWIAVRNGSLLRHLWGIRSLGSSFSWARNVWPLQWRYALTWVTGIFVFQLFTPVLFRVSGSDAAGRFGFTMSMTAVVVGYSQIWLAGRAAVFANLNAAGKWQELLALFRRSRMQSMLTFLAGSACMVSGLGLLEVLWPTARARALNWPGVLLLLAAQAVAVYGMSVTWFARSFREEPFVRMAWINAVLVSIAVVAGANLGGTTGVAAGYLGAQALVVPLARAIELQYRKRVVEEACS